MTTVKVDPPYAFGHRRYHTGKLLDMVRLDGKLRAATILFNNGHKAVYFWHEIQKAHSKKKGE